MKRAAGLVLTAVLFGCGTGTTTQGVATEPPTPPTDGTRTGSVGFNHVFSAGVTNAKVVLKTSLSTDAPTQIYNDATGNTETVLCTPSGNQCANFVNSHCGTTGICITTTTNTSTFYVWNASPTSANFAFPVPCDGKTYAAEVYSAIASGTAPATVLQIQDMAQAPAIVVNPDCTIATPPVWTAVTKPSLNIPKTIYAGLPAPNDTYTVGVNGVTYPFSSSYTMTALQGTGPAVAAKSYSVGGAVLAAPTTTAPITLTATFGLDRSILFSSEASTPWQLPVTGSATPIGSAQVTGP